MEQLGAAAARIKARIPSTLARAHTRPHVVVAVDSNHDDEAEAEVRAVDLHGNVINPIQIRGPVVGRLSIHGDLLCASHGWGLTSVVNVSTGAVTNVAPEPRKKVNAATPYCLLGHVPATGEYKVLRIQADDLYRQRRQACEVVTLGGVGDAGRWRRRGPPPVTLSMEPGSSSWNVAVVAGLAYFLVWWAGKDEQPSRADSLAVFDLATEEWRPATLQGPLTSSLLAGTRSEEEDEVVPLRFKFPNHIRVSLLRRHHFQLARLGESLVVVYSNVKKSLTELWFMEGMVDDVTPRWSRRYMLQCTPFGDDKFCLQYHYPLAVLDDGRILVWVESMSQMRAYDPVTSAWTDLATLTGGTVAGLHLGSLPSSTVEGNSVDTTFMCHLSLFEPLRWILRSATNMSPSFGSLCFSFILVLFASFIYVCLSILG